MKIGILPSVHKNVLNIYHRSVYTEESGSKQTYWIYDPNMNMGNQQKWGVNLTCTVEPHNQMKEIFSLCWGNFNRPQESL